MTQPKQYKTKLNHYSKILKLATSILKYERVEKRYMQKIADIKTTILENNIFYVCNDLIHVLQYL